MPNCSAVGCTDRSSKNSNINFHSVRNEWQNIQRKKPFRSISIFL